MADFITASYEESGSYLSGTVELYSSSSAYTFITAPNTYVYSASVHTGTIENYSSGSAYTRIYAPITYRYNGSLEIINSVREITVGPSAHAGKPTRL